LQRTGTHLVSIEEDIDLVLHLNPTAASDPL
jgi:hypothetical protein